MTTVRKDITLDDKDLRKIDDYVYKQKRKGVKTNRSKFMVESSLMRIENEKPIRKELIKNN